MRTNAKVVLRGQRLVDVQLVDRAGIRGAAGHDPRPLHAVALDAVDRRRDRCRSKAASCVPPRRTARHPPRRHRARGARRSSRRTSACIEQPVRNDTSAERLKAVNLASAESLRRAPAAAASTIAPRAPTRSASTTALRQRRRSSLHANSRTARTSGAQHPEDLDPHCSHSTPNTPGPQGGKPTGYGGDSTPDRTYTRPLTTK